MLRFSKKVEYALIAMLEVANHDTQELVTAKSLARQFHIPQEIMGKVLQSLAKKELLQSVQGVKGGYMLEKSLEDINLLNVVEALDGPISLIACSDGKLCGCDQIPTCNIKTPMEMIQHELAQFFNNISLKDLKNRYGSLVSMLGAKSLNVNSNNYYSG